MPRTPCEVDLLIFDLDGTLVDTLDDLTASVNFTLARFGRPALTRQQVEQFIGNGVRKLLERVLQDPPPEMLQEAMGHFRQHYHAHVCVHSRVYPGVEEVLADFSEKKKCILTNKPEEFALPLLQQLGLASHFDILLGGGDHFPLKPAPEGIRHILAQTGVSAEKAVMIGDSDTDILAGKAAGILTCAVTYGFRPAAFLQQLAPDFMIAELTRMRTLFC